MIKNYLKLEQIFEEIGTLENILSILSWDVATNMPLGSSQGRTQEMINLNQIIKQKVLSPSNEHLEQLLIEAKKENDFLNPFQKANLREIIKRIEDEKIIPAELENDFLLATTESEIAWRTAKKNNDYASFKPYLQKVLNYTKKIAHLKAKKKGLSLYDSLLDDYNQGVSSAEIKQNFDVLKQTLPPLIQKILKNQKTPSKTLALDIEQQKELNKKIMKQIGFDFQRGRLDESLHPFCGGTADDVRLTTFYNSNNFLDSFLATMHETGHGLYEQNLPNLYKNQPVGKAFDFAFHESQSLLMEKQVGKSKEFLTFLTQFLQKNIQLPNPSEWNFENLYQQTHQVKPDFVRIYSDEVTYPLHIILRFEIEQDLINDKLSLDDLPKVWNQKMEQYLGIVPPTDTLGCLQDIHWSQGSFGYFPSYLNGAIIASMVMEQIKKTNPEIQNDLLQGNLSKLNNYLNKNLRNYGSLFNHQDLLAKATDQTKINPDIFLNYLTDKYLK
ncbi:carboxypeptidase M32 ['Camptotheca acuminata' phytoplasma]|uniref:carboxypeptidase M32 n=1 Tax='Camptotheca acuminata' phytoplasma TaxID=3239192 RepID=UPI00351A402C